MGVSQGGEGGRALARPLPAPDSARSPAAATSARTLTAGDVAWLVAIPTAALALAAIALLGPPLGRTLLVEHRIRVWDIFREELNPEPAEHGRYAVAVAMPLLLAALTLAAARPRPRRASLVSDLLVLAAQAGAVGFALACLLQQREAFGRLYPPAIVTPRLVEYHSDAALLAAAAGTLALVAAVRSRRVWARLSAWTRETRGRGLVGAGLALVALGLWLLAGFHTERTIRLANFEVLYHIQFTMDETFAVLDGRSPLVNYASQYGSLWPYPFAAAMSVLGTSLGVWVALALTATGAGMLSIFAVLRRAARSSIRGLLLFAPVLATSFVSIGGTRVHRYSFETYFGTFPMRYAGPSILAWLVARHLGGAAPRRAWAVFLAAGLVVLNNADVGTAALAATAAALLWGGGALTRARLLRLALEAAGGLAAAFALVSVLTLVRAGAFPDLGMLLRFTRLFASSGFGMFPLPAYGLHLTIYVTFAAAIGVATVLALRPGDDRVLPGMLAWSGLFGLGASAYFVGRSTPDDLAATFFPWSFALALLLIPALGSLRAASWRRPPLAAAAVVFGFLLAACSLAQTPTPWEQIDRLGQQVGPILARPHGQGFIAKHTRPGEPAVILGLLSHRIGYQAGVDNVSPYSNSLAMPAVEQLDETIDALRAAGGRKLFVDLKLAQADMQHAIEDRGFRFAGVGAQGRVGLWVDRGARGRGDAPARTR
jgi:hypothetical protein